ncbi:hypothetical protein HY993_03145 [Candidatus Micrarchaeota archaeon]|nr:hypothetical protein [Candidatus Micrarchaeota archaeon]
MADEKNRDERVAKWALYCRNNMKKALAQTLPFIDDQLKIANEFYKRLEKEEGGREKIMQLRRLRWESADA